MASLNRVFLIGNLGADPELRYTPTNTAVANFRIATSEVWNDKSGQRQERTEWHRIVAWGKTAELCGEYLKKGRSVHIEGRLQTREWDDKNTGQKRYTTEIIADRVTFLGGRGEGGESSGAGGSTGGSGGAGVRSGSRGSSGPEMDGPPPLDDSDVPF